MQKGAQRNVSPLLSPAPTGASSQLQGWGIFRWPQVEEFGWPPGVTIYAWRKRYGQLEAVDVKRLRQLELENGRLKKLVAERDLDIEILKEVAAKKW
jgi:hypothetical protein